MGKTIQQAFDAFLAEIRLRPSKETARTYAAALRAFRIYLRPARIDLKRADLSRLTADHFLEVLHYLKGKPFRGRANEYSIATYLAIYLSWLRFLIRQELHPKLDG